MANPEVKYANSAGRLFSILTRITGNKPLVAQLAPLLLQENSPAMNKPQEVSTIGVRSISELHIMYSQFIEDMGKAEIGKDQRTVLLNGLSGMNRCIYPVNFTNAAAVLSDAEKSLLEVCATALPKEGILENDDLDSIKSSINELQNQIKNTETSPDLKKILLELIRLSEDAINRFHIHGSQGLNKAFKGMLAEVADLYLRANEEDKDEIRANKAWVVITDHLRRFDAVAAKVLQYSPLLENGGKLFLE